MEATVDKLEAMLKKAEADLDYASCRLETELAAACSRETGAQFNPLTMLGSVQQLRKEYEALVKEVKELQTTQQETYEKLQNEVQEVCRKLQNLEMRTGAPLNLNSFDYF